LSVFFVGEDACGDIGVDACGSEEFGDLFEG
jgi:hypothetical protein